jgi:molybdate transport system substrate-binding protein
MRSCRIIVLCALAALAGCGGSEGGDAGAPRPRLVVSAASSLSDALTGCSRSFPGAAVRLSFGGSDELAAQIRQGVKPDVFAAANTALPDALAAEGLLDRPRTFATNELVVAVRTGSELRALADLARAGVKVAVGSATVPVGAYTRKVLARLPARERQAILDNVRTEEPDVKGVVGKLAQGAVDAGFVYRTDVRAAGDALRAVGLPRSLQPRVEYGTGVVRGAAQPGLARRFVDDLARGTCARALRAAGFGAPATG